MQFADSQAALESEKVLIQSVLLNNDLLYLAEVVKPEDLQTDCHRKMLSAIRELVLSGKSVDEVILYEHFRASNTKIVADYVLTFDAMSTHNVQSHVEEIIRASQRRKIVAALESALHQAKDLSESNSDVLSVTQNRLLDLQQYSSESKPLIVSEFSEGFYEQIRKIADQERGLGAYTTGLVKLDEMTTGLRPKEFIVVGAYTGEGKTSYAVQLIAANCALGAKVLLFSQEMSKEAVLQRIIPQVTNGQIAAFKLRNPRKMNGTDRAILLESKAIVDRWQLWVNDASSMHASELVAQAHVMVKKHSVGLIVVDYLQLLRADGEKRYEQVSNASAALRELAKQQGVAVVAVSQLSRPEGKLKRKPTLFDLRESGQIEQDSHLVLFPYRPIDKKGHFTGEDSIIIGKQREGPVGDVSVVFDRSKLMFVPRETSSTEETPEEQESWWQK